MKDHEVVIVCHEWTVHGMAENEASQLLVGGTDVVERNGRIGDLGCVGRSVADMHLAGF